MANILLFGLDSNMRNRLTSAAEQELASLLSVLQDFMLSMEQHAHFLIGGRSSPPNAPMIDLEIKILEKGTGTRLISTMWLTREEGKWLSILWMDQVVLSLTIKGC